MAVVVVWAITLAGALDCDAEGAELSLRPGALAFDAATDRLYVADFVADKIVFFDGVTLAPVGAIDRPGETVWDAVRATVSGVSHRKLGFGLTLDPTADRLFVNNLLEDRISIFDLKHLREIGDFRGSHDGDSQAACSPGSLAVDDIRSRIFVADTCRNRIQIFDSNTLKWSSTIVLRTLNRPMKIAYDDRTDRIFVSYLRMEDDHSDLVEIIDGKTFDKVADLPNAWSKYHHAGAGQSDAPRVMGVDASNGYLYIGNRTGIDIYRTCDLSFVRSIGTEGRDYPVDNEHFGSIDGFAVDNRSGRIFVSDERYDRIQVFDAKNFNYLTTIGTPRYSQGPFSACKMNPHWPGQLDLDANSPRDTAILKRFGPACDALAIERDFDAGPGLTVYSCQSPPQQRSGLITMRPERQAAFRTALGAFAPWLSSGDTRLIHTDDHMSSWASTLLIVADAKGSVHDILFLEGELNRIHAVNSIAGAADMLQLMSSYSACAGQRAEAIEDGWRFSGFSGNCDDRIRNYEVGRSGIVTETASSGPVPESRRFCKVE